MTFERLPPSAVLGLLGVLVLELLLVGCVAIAGPCDLTRERSGWRLACDTGGAAVVVPPSTLQTIVAPVPEANP